MSGRSKKKAAAVSLSAPASPAGEVPAAEDSRPLKSKSFAAGLYDRWSVPGVCIFLAAIVWLVFGQTVRHKFVNYDDEFYVADYPTALGGLSLKGIVWAFTHDVNVNWTPLAVISHMLDCQFYGTNAGWHHLTSVLLHMASAIALFLVLKRMTTALWRSAFVAAVFAVHPLHVESVAWIAERRDVLSGLFFMLTLGAYARYVQKQSRVEDQASSAGAGSLALDLRLSTFDYFLVLLFFALGLMSKPMVVTLPFVLLLLDYWPLKRFAQPGRRLVPWRLIVEKVPLLALSGAACVVTLFAQKGAIASLPLSLRIGNALVSYVVYIRQMICPVGLAVCYPYPENGLPLWKMIAAFILLLIISAVAVAVRRKQPWFIFGWLWYLGMLVPAIGLIQSGLRAQADRYTYLPQIGLYLLLTWAAADLCAGWRHRRQILGIAAFSVMAALMVCAWKQTSYWRNSESLWTHTLACTTGNFIAHNNLGNVLLQKGKADEAINQYQKALQIKPDSAKIHSNFGDALLQEGRRDEAITHFQKALQINPDDTEALNNLAWLLATCPDAHSRDGVQAVKYARRACKLTHYGATPIVGTLAAAYAEAGRYDEAIAVAQKACALATAAGERKLLEKNQQLLVLYRAHQPYHEAAGKVVPAKP